MQIKLYKNLSEVNTIGKTLTEESARTGTLKDGCSVLSPSVVLTGENLSGFNYAYIPQFSRYYFIKEITSVKSGLWEISMRVDVLETYKSQIKAQKAVVERQEQKYNLYLNDPDWKVYCNKQVLTRTFPSGFLDTGVYYLTVVGGYDNMTEGSVV